MFRLLEPTSNCKQQGEKSAYNFSKTNFGIQFGQYNSFENDFAFELNQSFEFPTVYSSQRNLAKEKIEGSQMQLSITENDLKRLIRSSWYQLAYLKEKEGILLYQDTIYSRFLRAATIRYETRGDQLFGKSSSSNQSNEYSK